MKSIKYSAYLLLLMLLPVVSSFAGSNGEEARQLSNAMFLFLGLAGSGLLIAYLVWKATDGRKKRNPVKPVNRGPVKRPVVAYQKRKAA